MLFNNSSMTLFAVTLASRKLLHTDALSINSNGLAI
jgi:hypothetical protein